MTWDCKNVAILLEGKSQDFHDLGLQECSHVTRGDIPGHGSPGMSPLVKKLYTFLQSQVIELLGHPL